MKAVLKNEDDEPYWLTRPSDPYLKPGEKGRATFLTSSQAGIARSKLTGKMASWTLAKWKISIERV